MGEAVEDHQKIKLVIAQIRGLSVADAAMDQLVADVARAVQDHVKEERDKLFPKARSAPGLALASLGLQLKARQLQLTQGAAATPA